MKKPKTKRPIPNQITPPWPDPQGSRRAFCGLLDAVANKKSAFRRLALLCITLFIYVYNCQFKSLRNFALSSRFMKQISLAYQHLGARQAASML